MCCRISRLEAEQSGSQQLRAGKNRPRRQGKAPRVDGDP
jgi:hypothetical protein